MRCVSALKEIVTQGECLLLSRKFTVHEVSTYESFLEDQPGENSLINFDFDTVLMIHVKFQRVFDLRKYLGLRLSKSLVLLR